jgi:hypothetical protein
MIEAMKRLKNILPILGLGCLLVACDFNEVNFPGYDDEVAPTNVFEYEDSLVAADYTSISKLGLAAATNAEDSAAAKSIATEGMFNTESAPASNYIPLWLANKYLYGDAKSSVVVTSYQYIAEEGEAQYVQEKYILDSVWTMYDAEILGETFMTDLGKFTTVSVLGDQVWGWSSYKSVGFAKMSGYSSGNLNNEDWLISPAMNFTKRQSAIFTFDHTHKYGVDDYASQMTVWVTDSYVSGNPDTLQWKKLAFNYNYSLSYTFASSDSISLDDYAGKTNVRVAFRYASTNTVSAPTWEIQNVLIVEPE